MYDIKIDMNKVKRLESIPQELWDEMTILERCQLVWGMDEENRNYLVDKWKKNLENGEKRRIFEA